MRAGSEEHLPAGGVAACPPVCSEHIGDVGGGRQDSSSPTDAVPSEDVLSSSRMQSASLQMYQCSVSVLGRTCGRGLIRLTVCLSCRFNGFISIEAQYEVRYNPQMRSFRGDKRKSTLNPTWARHRYAQH
jgi:hypothetical protein